MATDGTSPAPPLDALAEMREVVGRAKRGDAAAVPRLRELLDHHPEIWERYGDLAAQVEGAWVGLAAGGDLYLRESVTRYAAKLRAELARPSASPVEMLLVERAVATWLQVNYFSGVEANAVAGDALPKLLQLRARRQAQAQRQHERALSALVLYQKLHPAAPAREVVPPVAPTASAAHPVRPLAPPVALPDEIASFDGAVEHRTAERVRVGVSS